MITNSDQGAGYLVVAMRHGKPVIAEGYAAHADTASEAAQVADAWRGVGEAVQVFALEPVEPSPPFPPIAAVTHILNQPTVGVGSPAGVSGTRDRGTVGHVPVAFSSQAGLASIRGGV